jgi:hypothetical protein
MEQMTNPKPLSPAAQAVLDSVLQVSNLSPTVSVAAAALRVAAYRVVPAQPVLDSCCEHFEQSIRHKILAIADELENH